MSRTVLSISSRSSGGNLWPAFVYFIHTPTFSTMGTESSLQHCSPLLTNRGALKVTQWTSHLSGYLNLLQVNYYIILIWVLSFHDIFSTGVCKPNCSINFNFIKNFGQNSVPQIITLKSNISALIEMYL